MSIFNRPYRTDAQLEADKKEEAKRERMKKREKRNRLASQIFDSVLNEIENNAIESFSKEEMVALIAGNGKISSSEWYIWDKACTIAIQHVRRYFWSKRDDTTLACLFNYDEGRYWLIPVNDEDKTRRVYDGYDRKMRGLNKKQMQIAASAYGKLLALDPGVREALIEQLKSEKMLKNGKPKK
jgi:hypothetical protein